MTATATMERTDQTVEIIQGGGYGLRTLQPGDTYPVPTNEMFEIPDPARGKNDTPSYQDYIAALDIERIAATLIARHGDGIFGHLQEATVVYRWKREGGKVGGKVRLGSCRRLDSVSRHFALGAQFLIAISADNCRVNRLTARQMEALVFHELCHIDAAGTEEEPTLALAPHDWEGFTAEWRVYGPWRSDLKALAKVIQPMLPGIAENGR